jgi:hypothetical protein
MVWHALRHCQETQALKWPTNIATGGLVMQIYLLLKQMDVLVPFKNSSPIAAVC